MAFLKTQVIIDGVTIKDDDGGPDPRLLFRWEYERTNESGIAELVITSPQSINNTVTLAVGKTVTVHKGFTTSTDEKVFEGFISKFEPNGGLITIGCRDKMWDLVRRNVNKIYDADADPQAGVISAIAKDLIETHGGLTATVVDTGTEEGRTIGKFRCVHTDIYERLMALAKAVDYQVFYDPVNDTVHFEPRGFNNPGLTLTTGTEIISVPEWDYDTSQMVNDLRVDGAVSETNLRLPLSGSGQINTTQNFDDDGITLPKTPESIELLLDSSDPPTTIREGGSEDGSTGNFFFVDKENRKVKPVTGTTFPSGDFAIVNYTWLAPSPIHMANSASIDEFGKFEKEVTLPDIITVSDAEARAVEILARFSNPFSIASFLIRGYTNLNINVGDTVIIVDSVNNPNVNAEFVVQKQMIKYPGSSQEITVGDKELTLAEWQQTTEERLKRLEEQFLANQDLILELFNFQNTFTSVPRYRKVQTANIAGDTLIWGSPSFGNWGEFNWGSQSNFGFVLGHASAGILGTSQLGSNTSTPVDHFIQQYQNIYIEDFIDEDFEDTVNTTAAWTTTGSVTFTASQVAQSSSADFNNSTITAATLTVTIISGSFTLEMSADGGITFETVTSGAAHTFSNPGTDLRFRITENAASTGEISQVKITGYH